MIEVITGMTSSFTIPLLIAGSVALVGAANYASFMPRVEPIRN